MLVIPAIDLIQGQCVRLSQGDRKNRTVYSDKPEEIALQWASAGARILHLVNLDGAFGDAKVNIELIKRIRKNVELTIELGGGIRSLEDAEAWLERVAIDRIILGTVAVTHPEWVADAVARFGADRIVVGIDARNDRVATHGWEEQTEITAIDLAQKMKTLGVQRLIYTDVSRDGMLAGPNLTATRELADQVGLAVIASGGFSRLEHFEALQAHQQSGIEGAIVGKALYEGHLELSDLINRFQESDTPQE